MTTELQRLEVAGLRSVSIPYGRAVQEVKRAEECKKKKLRMAGADVGQVLQLGYMGMEEQGRGAWF